VEGVDVKAEAVEMKQRPGGGAGAAFGWALGALIVAIALSFATNILFVDVLDAAIDPFTGGGVVPEWIQAVGSALIVGGAIGAVIGSRVARGAVGWAIGTSAFYVLLWPFASLFLSAPLMVTAMVLHVVAAALAARWMSRRKLAA
jgi:hypothetical protein